MSLGAGQGGEFCGDAPDSASAAKGLELGPDTREVRLTEGGGADKSKGKVAK